MKRTRRPLSHLTDSQLRERKARQEDDLQYAPGPLAAEITKAALDVTLSEIEYRRQCGSWAKQVTQ